MGAEGFERVATGNTWTDGKDAEQPDNVFVHGCRMVRVTEYWDEKGHIPSESIPSDHAPIMVQVQ